MAIDMVELKRMMTNAMNADQRISIGNIVKGVISLENENRVLKAKNAKLEKQVEDLQQ